MKQRVITFEVKMEDVRTLPAEILEISDFRVEIGFWCNGVRVTCETVEEVLEMFKTIAKGEITRRLDQNKGTHSY